MATYNFCFKNHHTIRCFYANFHTPGWLASGHRNENTLSTHSIENYFHAIKKISFFFLQFFKSYQITDKGQAWKTEFLKIFLKKTLSHQIKPKGQVKNWFSMELMSRKHKKNISKFRKFMLEEFKNFQILSP